MSRTGYSAYPYIPNNPNPNNKAEPLVGGYVHSERRIAVFKKFNEYSSRLQSQDLLMRLKDDEDIIVKNLSLISQQINKLSVDASDYIGPCFSELHRTLQGHCAKLQMDLDELDLEGRNEEKELRKEALFRIDKIAKGLDSKAHSSGESCPKCYIQF